VVVGLDIARFGQLHCIVHVGAQTCPGAQMPGMHTWRQVGVLGSCGIGVAGMGGGGGGGGGGRTMTCAKAGLAVSTINTNSAMRAITVVLPLRTASRRRHRRRDAGRTSDALQDSTFGLVARDQRGAAETLERPR